MIVVHLKKKKSGQNHKKKNFSWTFVQKVGLQKHCKLLIFANLYIYSEWFV